MTPEVESLLRRFVSVIASSEEVIRRSAGVPQTVRRPYAVITRSEPEAGVVEMERLGRPVRLHFDENRLLELLAGAGDDSLKVWGRFLSDEEAAVQYLSMFLMESIGTREPDASGWWEFDGHGFVPVSR